MSSSAPRTPIRRTHTTTPSFADSSASSGRRNARLNRRGDDPALHGRAWSAGGRRCYVLVELASPGDFIPLPGGWEERSIYAASEGRVTFRHFDPYSQALAKLERAHTEDLADVQAMVDEGLVDHQSAIEYFDSIEPDLYRFPAVDPRTFRRRVEEVLGGRVE